MWFLRKFHSEKATVIETRLPLEQTLCYQRNQKVYIEDDRSPINVSRKFTMS